MAGDTFGVGQPSQVHTGTQVEQQPNLMEPTDESLEWNSQDIEKALHALGIVQTWLRAESEIENDRKTAQMMSRKLDQVANILSRLVSPARRADEYQSDGENEVESYRESDGEEHQPRSGYREPYSSPALSLDNRRYGGNLSVQASPVSETSSLHKRNISEKLEMSRSSGTSLRSLFCVPKAAKSRPQKDPCDKKPYRTRSLWQKLKIKPSKTKKLSAKQQYKAEVSQQWTRATCAALVEKTSSLKRNRTQTATILPATLSEQGEGSFDDCTISVAESYEPESLNSSCGFDGSGFAIESASHQEILNSLPFLDDDFEEDSFTNSETELFSMTQSMTIVSPYASKSSVPSCSDSEEHMQSTNLTNNSSVSSNSRNGSERLHVDRTLEKIALVDQNSRKDFSLESSQISSESENEFEPDEIGPNSEWRALLDDVSSEDIMLESCQTLTESENLKLASASTPLTQMSDGNVILAIDDNSGSSLDDYLSLSIGSSYDEDDSYGSDRRWLLIDEDMLDRWTDSGDSSDLEADIERHRTNKIDGKAADIPVLPSLSGFIESSKINGPVDFSPFEQKLKDKFQSKVESNNPVEIDNAINIEKAEMEKILNTHASQTVESFEMECGVFDGVLKNDGTNLDPLEAFQKITDNDSIQIEPQYLNKTSSHKTLQITNLSDCQNLTAIGEEGIPISKPLMITQELGTFWPNSGSMNDKYKEHDKKEETNCSCFEVILVSQKHDTATSLSSASLAETQHNNDDDLDLPYEGSLLPAVVNNDVLREEPIALAGGDCYVQQVAVDNYDDESYSGPIMRYNDTFELMGERWHRVPDASQAASTNRAIRIDLTASSQHSDDSQATDKHAESLITDVSELSNNDNSVKSTASELEDEIENSKYSNKSRAGPSPSSDYVTAPSHFSASSNGDSSSLKSLQEEHSMYNVDDDDDHDETVIRFPEATDVDVIGPEVNEP